ncbi:MAG: RrF2 family transcriptional regulator [Candidatus Fimivivens sp.]
MHITLESDYAVRIVDCLSVQEARLGAGSIAEQTGVTPRFTLKILHKLVSSGLVRSYKGAKGGYELAQNPDKITLRAVIEVIEGPYTFSRCLNPVHDCKCTMSVCRSGNCRFQRVYDEISEIVRAKLDETTFSQ